MYLIILFSLIGIVLSNSISLNHIYEDEIKSSDLQIKPFGSLKNTNHECVKQKLKLSEIGEKLIAQELGINTVRTAALLCMNDKSVYEKILKYISKNIPAPENLECYKRRLQELQADSKFLSDFIPDSSINCDEPIKITEGRKAMLQALGVYDCVMNKNVAMEKTGIKVILIKKLLNEPNGLPNDIKNEMFDDMDADNEILLECSLEKIK
ncbi:hypothetical protein PVAND_014625 [Polypedilum vanderplanki]|uniref:Uncharacterized protein n=1 Tax=Polypedilum vanderplanki TaxID=319348 RepID=A0A9J6B9Q3_POLVA|nr:hypothetical protein PVAND_014625 [Polypedilum vanderplanki]